MPTISPVYDDKGNVRDFSVDSGHRPTDSGNDFFENEHGELKHRFQETTLASDEGFQQADYESLLYQEYPDLASAQQWASNAMSHEDLSEYNNAINSGDLDKVHNQIQWLLDRYQTEVEADEAIRPNDSEDTDPYEAIEDWYDELTDELVDATVGELLETSFSEDEATEMEHMMSTYDEGTAQSAVLEMGVAIARGEISQADAIRQVTDSFGEARAFAAYLELQQLFNS